MKTRTWILIFSALAALCIVLSLIFFLPSDKKNTALVYSDGKLVQTIDLTQDAEYQIEFENGCETAKKIASKLEDPNYRSPYQKMEETSDSILVLLFIVFIVFIFTLINIALSIAILCIVA